ncbi:MAG TPA: hypothetical protein VN224_00715 [Xanthomonadales bacterium]|nr:hypothetical protein [Xanthomonadales bacterium]
MHTLFRGIALGAVVSLASAGTALAAQVDVKPGAVGLNVTTIPLANGQSIYCRKAGGTQWQVFIRNRDGKQVPAPPGSYKQKNGNVIVVGTGGLTSPGSKVMLNPQPLPP